MHVFGDILNWLPAGVKEQLLDLQGRFLMLWQQTKLEQPSGNLQKADLIQWQEDLSEEYITELYKTFDVLEFEATAFCHTHGKLCKLSPFADPALKAMLWIDGAGSTCCPWASPSHCQNKWLDEATLVMFTWAYHRRFIQPDLLLHECTEKFPIDTLLGIFNRHAGRQPKCLHSREIQPVMQPALADILSEEEHDMHAARGKETGEAQHWRLESVVFSPTDLGIPSRRRRRYSCIRFNDTAPNFADSLDFAETFARERQLTAQIYLDIMQTSAPADDLFDAQIARLDGHFLNAHRRGLCSDTFSSWTVPFALVDVTQSEQWDGKASYDTFPTVLRKSRLVNLVNGKCVPPPVYWAAQGFQHPVCASCADTEHGLPFDASLLHGGLSAAEQRSLLGNSMHRQQMGSWFLHCFACIDVQWSNLCVPSTASASGHES